MVWRDNMKRLILTAVLAICMVGVAQADPFSNVLYPNVQIGEGETYSYSHDLMSSTPVPVNVPAGDVVTSAELRLTFDDGELVEQWEWVRHGFMDWRYELVGYEWNPSDSDLERAWVRLDNGSWEYVDEVDNDSYVIGSLTLDMLNDDGILGVDVYVNNYSHEGYADITLTQSALVGEFTPVPVPGAILLGILGLSAAGVKLRKFA